MKVKIIGTELSTTWYADKVGEVFEVELLDPDSWLFDTTYRYDGLKYSGFIPKKYCELVPDDEVTTFHPSKGEIATYEVVPNSGDVSVGTIEFTEVKLNQYHKAYLLEALRGRVASDVGAMGILRKELLKIIGEDDEG